MSTNIHVKALSDFRAIRTEELADDQPLSADIVFEIMSGEVALYEFLTDQAVTGNDQATVDGHSHNKDDLGGIYIDRHGSFYIGHIFEQSSNQTSYVPVAWEIFNTGGPASSGIEQAGNRIITASPAIFVHKDYKKLRVFVMIKAGSGVTCFCRLSLYNGDTLLKSQEISTVSSSWRSNMFELSIDNEDAFTGWLNLKLEIKSSDVSGSAYVWADDTSFKPVSGSIMNGTGLLLGENS